MLNKVKLDIAPLEEAIKKASINPNSDLDDIKKEIDSQDKVIKGLAKANENYSKRISKIEGEKKTIEGNLKIYIKDKDGINKLFELQEKKFNNALNKGLDYVSHHDSKDIAKIISPQFPDIALNDLTKIVKNYQDADTWYENTSINKDDFVNLENMLIKNDLIKKYVSYDKLIIDLNE